MGLIFGILRYVLYSYLVMMTLFSRDDNDIFSCFIHFCVSYLHSIKRVFHNALLWWETHVIYWIHFWPRVYPQRTFWLLPLCFHLLVASRSIFVYTRASLPILELFMHEIREEKVTNSNFLGKGGNFPMLALSLRFLASTSGPDYWLLFSF